MAFQQEPDRRTFYWTPTLKTNVHSATGSRSNTIPSFPCSQIDLAEFGRHKFLKLQCIDRSLRIIFMDRPAFQGSQMDAVQCWEGLSRVSTGSGADGLEYRCVNCLFNRSEIDKAISKASKLLQSVLKDAHDGVLVARITPLVVANTEVSSNLTFFSLY